MKNTRRYLLILALIVTGNLLLSKSGFAENPSELQKIQDQIRILNLLNGLELNENQKGLLLHYAKEAQSLRAQHQKTMSLQEEELRKAHQKVLEHVQHGELDVPEQVKRDFHHAKRYLNIDKAGTQQKLHKLVSAVIDTLEPHQLYVLENFTPCIIPHVQNGRIGQAQDLKRLEKKFARLKALTQDEYMEARHKIAQKMISNFQAILPPGYNIEQTEVKVKLLAILDKLYQMSALDFAIKKENIMEEVKNLYPRQRIKNIGVMAERFLLHPAAIPLLAGK